MQYPPNQGSSDPRNQSQYPQQPSYPAQQPINYQQPQYPQQQPPFTMPPQQPPVQPQKPKSKVGRGCAIAIGVIVALIIIIVVASTSHGGSTPTTANSNNTTTHGTATAPAQPTTHKVGDTVTLDGWQASVNSVKTAQGNPSIDQLKSGDIFLEINISAKNTTGQAQTFSSLLSLALQDSTGQKYNETIVSDAGAVPDGNVANGAVTRGTICYEVPASMKTFTLTYQPSITSTDTTSWSLSV